MQGTPRGFAKPPWDVAVRDQPWEWESQAGVGCGGVQSVVSGPPRRLLRGTFLKTMASMVCLDSVCSRI